MNELAYRTLLGGYVLRILDSHEHQAVDEHLPSCEDCRRELAELSETTAHLDAAAKPFALEPAELAQLEADGAELESGLVLQRTLRQARIERRRSRRPRLAIVAAAIVLLFVSAATAGVAIGHHRAPRVAAAPTSGLVGGRTVVAQDPTTGTRIVATIFADAGFTRFDVHLTGEPRGGRCQLLAIATDGTRNVASSWAVPPNGTGPSGTHVTGSVAIPVSRLREIEVRTMDGHHVVGVDLV